MSLDNFSEKLLVALSDGAEEGFDVEDMAMHFRMAQVEIESYFEKLFEDSYLETSIGKLGQTNYKLTNKGKTFLAGNDLKTFGNKNENYESKRQEGFIYILINPLLKKDLLKIGMTTRDPETRARELSIGSGVPIGYYVAYEEKVSDCELAEKMVHERLFAHRLRDDREFFALPLKKAIKIAQEIVEEVNRHYIQEQPPSDAEFDPPTRGKVQDGISRGGIKFTHGIEALCRICGKRYSVTLTRYEDYTICPDCYSLEAVNVKW